MFKLDIVLLGFSVLAAFVALFYINRAWFLLTLTPDEVLRAKAFLTKPFLHRNFVFIFVVSIFIAIHILEFAELFGYPVNFKLFFFIHIVYILTLMGSMILFALLYYWHRLLSSKKI